MKTVRTIVGNTDFNHNNPLLYPILKTLIAV
jgi:hypothetical protein